MSGTGASEARPSTSGAVDVSVVVPTKDEADNVRPLLSRLVPVLESIGSSEVLFVDDSDDHTPEVVREVTALVPVRLIHREPSGRKGGLGGAVIEGFRAARGRMMVVMDADLQHPPELVPALVAPLVRGEAQVAVASRFLEGGSSLGLSGPLRRLAAMGTRSLAGRVVPKIRHVTDPMSGYFAVERSVLEDGPASSEGFKILLDVLAHGSWSSVVEVPYVFAQRSAGSSKATPAVGLTYLRQLWRIRQGVVRSGSVHASRR